jgi:hypothetical protein
MARIQFTDVQARPTEFLDFTSLTLDEFQLLVLPFEAAFQARMAAWRLDGKPRTARQFRVYKNCPLPTPEVVYPAATDNSSSCNPVKFPYVTLVRRGICEDTQPVVVPDPFACPRLDLPHDLRLVARLFQSPTSQALQA